MPIDKDVLTTGEVAKICNVAPRTVSKWFDSGQLKGYRIPGSKDRRIPVPELIKFMKSHGIPMDGITGGRTRVLIVDDEAEVVTTLRDVLIERTSYDVRVAGTGFEAGVECERFRPHVLLIDMHLGDNNDSEQLARHVLGSENLSMTKIIAMSGRLTDGQAAALTNRGFEGFLRKPFQVRQVVESIEAATAMVY
ncbi:MAG: response regulator [Planctomycetota bacterium]